MQSKKTIRILVIDDDEEFAQLLSEFLEAEGGFSVVLRHTGPGGISAATNDTYDVLLLDVGLPGLNGFEVLKQLREVSDTPVIMLTARGDDIDRILGLEIGADDYVPKPCNLRELVARIRAIQRRVKNSVEGNGSTQLHLGDLKIEPASQAVYLNNTLIPLTGAEFLVLEALTQAVGQVVDKDTIARQALGRRLLPHDRRVDAHVSNLRKKLGPLEDGRQRIKTVRGRGYLFIVVP